MYVAIFNDNVHLFHKLYVVVKMYVVIFNDNVHLCHKLVVVKMYVVIFNVYIVIMNVLFDNLYYNFVPISAL